MTALFAAIAAAAVVALLVQLWWSRRRATALRAELESTRRIVELANDPVLVADLVRGNILVANAAACALLGFEREQLLARRLPELHPDELTGRSAEVIADVWERRGLVYSDLPFVRADGERVDVEISANVLQLGGKPALLIYARDIRRRLRAEAKIRDQARQLELTNRELREAQGQLVQRERLASLGTLAAGLAHEINTPIGSILANTSVSQRALAMLREAGVGGDDDKKIGRALGALHEATATNASAAERIGDLVTSLRNFARLDEAEEKSVDVHEGIESTLMLLRPQLGSEIEVVRQFAELPPVRCFPAQLNQAFMQLLQNAINAIEGKGRITVSTAVENDDVVVRIADSGRGIAKENLERIFDPGFTTKGVGVGSGLGLSICYRVARDHGGSIAVTSQVGKGSEFTLRLPIGR